METLIEEMKRCHAKLAAQNLLPVKKRNKKKVSLKSMETFNFLHFTTEFIDNGMKNGKLKGYFK